jgi:hypothetical protein
MQGIEVLTEIQSYAGKNAIQLDLSFLGKGVYITEWMHNGSIEKKRLMVN